MSEPVKHGQKLRQCKALLEGMEEIDAVQLATLPPFRWRMLASGEEVEFVDAKT